MNRTLRAKEVADIIGEWAARVLEPACRPFPYPLPFLRDEECSQMLAAIGNDPAGDLSEHPQELLALAKFRVMYVLAMAAITPAHVLLELDEAVPDHVILSVLLGGYLAELAIPVEYRPQFRHGSGQRAPGGGWAH